MSESARSAERSDVRVAFRPTPEDPMTLIPVRSRTIAAAAALAVLSLAASPAWAMERVHPGPGTPNPSQVVEPKTLAREPDPVVLPGSAIPGAKGLALGGFRLFAHRGGRVQPIPFDINERDEEGLYVLPSGKEPMKGTGRFAANSELAYMAHDAGDRVASPALPAGWERAFEIETNDPLDGARAWAYLLYFAAGAPAKSPEDYVGIREVKEKDPFTGKPYAELTGKGFYVRNTEGSTSWYHFRGTREAGYEEKSFSDHVSVRNRLEILGLVPFNVNEESIWSETPNYYDGAVRFIRRVRLKILVGKIKVPTGIVYDVTGYDRIANVPAKIKIPAAVKAISRDAWAWYGLDLNSDAAGKYTFYSNNHPEGLPITGVGDPEAKNFGFEKKELVPSRKYWSVVAGPYGTLMRRHIASEDLEKKGFRHYVTFVDDRKQSYAPEYEKGQVGNVLTWMEVQNAPYGEVTFGSYWYYPPRFKYPDDVQTYLNILDHPLTSKATAIAPKGAGGPSQAQDTSKSQ